MDVLRLLPVFDSSMLEAKEGFSTEPPTYVISEEDVVEVRAAMKAKAEECMSTLLQMPSMRKILGNAILVML